MKAVYSSTQCIRVRTHVLQLVSESLGLHLISPRRGTAVRTSDCIQHARRTHTRAWYRGKCACPRRKDLCRRHRRQPHLPTAAAAAGRPNHRALKAAVDTRAAAVRWHDLRLPSCEQRRATASRLVQALVEARLVPCLDVAVDVPLDARSVHHLLHAFHLPRAARAIARRVRALAFPSVSVRQKWRVRKHRQKAVSSGGAEMGVDNWTELVGTAAGVSVSLLRGGIPVACPFVETLSCVPFVLEAQLSW